MTDSLTNSRGLLMASRYAFMPNKLRYCGGDQNAELFSYSVNQGADAGLAALLKEFETMYPYLKFIAEASGLTDPFAYPVVEAYWIGNDLLDKIQAKNFYRHLTDNLKIKKKVPTTFFEKLRQQLSGRALPHHSFHVFNTWRGANVTYEQTLKTMDDCRIGWGVISEITETELTISAPSLIAENGRILLSESYPKKVQYKFLSQTFITTPKIKDYVSYHWNWACDILSNAQVKNLKKYTEHHLDLLNNNHWN